MASRPASPLFSPPCAALPEQAAIALEDAWFTAAELADLALPGLPADKRSINRRAVEERWASRLGEDRTLLVRKRAGRGGGSEFHIALLPGEARLELARRGIVRERPAPVADANAARWAWFDAQKASVKAKAQARLAVLNTVETLCASGLTQGAAVAAAAAQHGIGKSTILGWIKLVRGLERVNWLPALAPNFKGGGEKAEIPEELWQEFLSDYLRLSKPTLTSCYRRTALKARQKGLSLPSERTFARRVDHEVDLPLLRLRREGEEALRRSLPAQRRSVTDLRVLEHVNIDGHKFDVFVQPPPGSPKTKPIRPMMVAIQDIRSSKIVAWRVAESECAAVTRLAFADLFRNYGIPRECTLDNGRAFASKWITGGTKTRFRFKVRDEEPTGLLIGLGIEIHWALPFRGQSKPIERAFRDLCDTIAKHPAMEGAYTGNSPAAKPENYGSRAIPWADFVAHVEQGIAMHNAQEGRRGRDYAGRSFDQVFEEMLQHSPVGKATPEQLRMALLAADQKLVNRQTGEIELYGNRYWSLDCSELHGQRVTVRFDPEDLHGEVYLYDQAGRYLTAAQLVADTGFSDVDGAKATAKRVKDLRERVRTGEEAHRLLRAEEVAGRQAQIRAVPIPEPRIVRPVRSAGNTAAALRPANQQDAAQAPDPLDRISRSALRLVQDD